MQLEGPWTKATSKKRLVHGSRDRVSRRSVLSMLREMEPKNIWLECRLRIPAEYQGANRNHMAAACPLI